MPGSSTHGCLWSHQTSTVGVTPDRSSSVPGLHGEYPGGFDEGGDDRRAALTAESPVHVHGVAVLAAIFEGAERRPTRPI